MKRIGLIIIVLLFFYTTLFSQLNISGGKVHGNFQLDFQTYQVDSIIGVKDLNGKETGMNAFGNLIYENGRFTAGIRYEAYLPPLNGFESAYEGNGIANRFLKYTDNIFEVTVGNFYEQFGNGLIFRAYEEWALGIDNSVDGVSLKIKPIPGIILKGIYGTQRYYWNKDIDESNKPLIRGVDAEFSINEIFPSLENVATRLSLGVGFVSKYEKDDPFFKYKLPESVSAYSVRMNLNNGGLNLQTEYAYKINDPNNTNGFIYKPGKAFMISGSYSRKGIGLIVSAKQLDNFNFSAMRSPKQGVAPMINFLPSLAYQHSYSLLAMYPYATQSNGEIGYSGELFFNIPKKTWLGGKYGTKLSFNVSHINALNKDQIAQNIPIGEKGTDGYKAEFMSFGRIRFYQDLSVKISKKISRKMKLIAGFSKIDYNAEALKEGNEDVENMYLIKAGFLDFTYKFNRRNAIRAEIQYLNTEDDLGNWALFLLEYSMAPKWFFTVQDQINLKNPDTNEAIHYYTVGATFVNKGTRLGVSYGRQKEGMLCVGGVCRQVKAAAGFTINLTQSF